MLSHEDRAKAYASGRQIAARTDQAFAARHNHMIHRAVTLHLTEALKPRPVTIADVMRISSRKD